MTARSLRSRRRFAAALVALAIACPAFAQDPAATAAQRAARDWLVHTDALDAKAAWESAGKKFREAMTVEKWGNALRRDRAPRGKFERRTIVRTQFRGEEPGAPPGDYALVVFRTAFANRTSDESVTLERESDGVWRVVGYVIR